MTDIATRLFLRRISLVGLLLVAVMGIGTFGYRWIGGEKTTLLDGLYMTFITVSTIGYSEVIDLTANPGGRIFTMVIAFSGIIIMTFMISLVTAFAVEGELDKTFKRRRMAKMINKLQGHYIVCGGGNIGANIIRELTSTQRPFVLIDPDREIANEYLAGLAGMLWIEGDATEDDTLRMAGIERAAGIFAVSGSDHVNLVIALSARQLRPDIRIVARCHDMRSSEKLRRAGADSIVSPDAIGALRIASEMLRPTVVSFLDQMLRERHAGLRIEEITLTPAMAGRPLDALAIDSIPGALLLALRRGDDWQFNPDNQQELESGDTLIFMLSPDARSTLNARFT